MTETLDHLRRWIGRTQETGEVVDLLRARALQGTLDDPATMGEMMRAEFCGRRGRIDGRGGLRVG